MELVKNEENEENEEWWRPLRPREAATIVLKHPEDFNKAHQVIDKCADMDKASSVPIKLVRATCQGR